MKFNQAKISRVITQLSSIALILWGLALVLSWQFGRLDFVSPALSPKPLPYFLAIATLLSGIACLLLLYKSHMRMARLFGALVILLVHAEHFLPSGFGKYLLFNTPADYPHIRGLSIFSFSLTGLTLLLWTKVPGKNVLSGILTLFSVIIFVIGLVTVLNYVLPLESNLGVQMMIASHFYASITLLLTGISLISLNLFYDSRFETGVSKSLPMTVAVGITIFTILLFFGLKEARSQVIVTIVQEEVDDIKKNTEKLLEENHSFIDQLALDYEASKGEPYGFKPSIKTFLKNHNYIQGIAIVDAEGSIKSASPEHFQPSVKRELSYYFSKELFWDNKAQGKLVEELLIDKLFTCVLANSFHREKNFTLAVLQGNQILFLSKPIAFQKWGQETAVFINGTPLTLKLYPTELLIQNYLNDTMLYVNLIGGCVLALCIGAMLRLWQLSQTHLSQEKGFVAKLEEKEREIKEVLTTAKMGNWSWHIPEDKIELDANAHLILGLNLETAVQDDKVMQSFDSELLLIGGDHSQKVKAPPIRNNYGSKDCVNLSSSTAVSRFKNGTFERGAATFQRVLYEGDKEILTQTIQSIRHKKSKLWEMSFRILWEDGSLHYIQSKGASFFNEKGELIFMKGICWDITATKTSETILLTSEGLIKVLSEETSLHEALVKVIRIISVRLGYNVLSLWRKNPQTQLLENRDIVKDPKVVIPAFIKATKEMKFDGKRTIPETVLITHRPCFLADFAKESAYVRYPFAVEDAIHAALAFPLFEGENMTGVIELFQHGSTILQPIDESLLNMLTTFGIELGQFIQKLEAAKSLNQLADIVTHSNDAIYSTDSNGIILTWNKGAERMFGWTKEEIVGKPVTVLYPEDKKQEFPYLLKQLQEKRSVNHFETERLRKDGERIWIVYTISPILDEKNNLQAISIVAQDVTKSRKLKKTLQESEDRFRMFIETTQEWVWETDAHFNFTYSIESVKNILGYTAEELEGMQMLLLVPEEDRWKMERELSQCIEKRKGWVQRTWRVRHKNGTICDLESTAEPILDEKKQLIGFRGSDRDVSERMAMEKSKSEFISMISHELRTPLTSIQGSIGLLLKSAENKMHQELLSIAYRNSERLNAIINDILDIQKLQLGKLAFHIAPMSISEVIQEAIASATAFADKAHVSLAIEGELTDIKVMGDSRRIMQVIMNLLSNAIKFSKEGSTVFVSMEERDTTVRTSIRDTGPGIPESFWPKIFEKFVQADTSDSRLIPGTGLGLNISKTIVERCGGTIHFTTEKDKGTIFFFDLPKETAR